MILRSISALLNPTVYQAGCVLLNQHQLVSRQTAGCIIVTCIITPFNFLQSFYIRHKRGGVNKQTGQLERACWRKGVAKRLQLASFCELLGSTQLYYKNNLIFRAGVRIPPSHTKVKVSYNVWGEPVFNFVKTMHHLPTKAPH